MIDENFNCIKYDLEENPLEPNNNYKVKLKQLKRGLNIDKFLFVEKNFFIFVYKDEKKDKIVSSPFEIKYNDELYITKLISPILLKINEKMYIIIDLKKNTNFVFDEGKVVLAIFEIYYNNDKNIFSTKLLNEINFELKSENYKIFPMSTNKIIIYDEYDLYYITLDENCNFKKEFQYQINSLKYNNYYVYKENETIRITSIINNEINYYILKNIPKYELPQEFKRFF